MSNQTPAAAAASGSVAQGQWDGYVSRASFSKRMNCMHDE